MKLKSMTWFAALICAFFVRPNAQTLNLPVPVFGQEQLPWCWAATDQMIRWHFERTYIQQCTIASNQNGKPCCSNLNGCITFGNTAIPNLGIYNYAYLPSVALPYSTMKSEINAGRPWIYAYKYNGGGGHLMVGDGYATDNASLQYVLVIDPLPVGVGSFRWVTYNEYKGGAGYSYSVLYQYYSLSLK